MSRLAPQDVLRHVELFSGGGGLAYGLRAAGFDDGLLIEVDAHSCQTLRRNSEKGGALQDARILEEDVRGIVWPDTEIGLLAAGAPCQPFSLGGKHKAHGDDRNLFPEVIRAIRALRPRVTILENVRGLARPGFRPYFDYIIRQLECPELAPNDEEDWIAHDRRLRGHSSSKDYSSLYNVTWAVLNAADYGVPQCRYRVFFVAIRRDVDFEFSFPAPTHSREELIRSQVSGEYWARHGLSAPSGARYSASTRDETNGLLPWATVRDVLLELGQPEIFEERNDRDHWLIPGARAYVGHSGSGMDWPSKTIKAGVHGVPGGENMVALDDGSVRYYTLREAATIQTFPASYVFPCSRSETIRQIGNAVPCRLAEAVAGALPKDELVGDAE
ncbi:MAG: DNA cytosine methyltransferase [Armatimonadetes bacterium]|nr:DNA cytosine methyltransferase [Armatimonadota bacterium]